jgi:hypothetical protein
MTGRIRPNDIEGFIEVSGLDEEPIGMYYTDVQPDQGISPEITFAVPYEMFQRMVTRWSESFLCPNTWATVRKKIHRSRKAWGDI